MKNEVLRLTKISLLRCAVAGPGGTAQFHDCSRNGAQRETEADAQHACKWFLDTTEVERLEKTPTKGGARHRVTSDFVQLYAAYQFGNLDARYSRKFQPRPFTVKFHYLQIPPLFGAVFVRFSLGGIRVSTGYDWPSDYSGHGGCQIGKRRIVVHKYTGLARKWNRGVVRRVRVDPRKRFCRTFWGSTTSCGESNPPDPRQIQSWLASSMAFLGWVGLSDTLQTSC